MLVTVERAMSVIDPLNVRSNVSNRRKSVMVWLIMATVLLLINCNFIWTTDLTNVTLSTASKNHSSPNDTSYPQKTLSQTSNLSGITTKLDSSGEKKKIIFNETSKINKTTNQTRNPGILTTNNEELKVPQCYFNKQHAYFTEHIWPWIDFIICVTLPFLLIALCNVLILVCVWRTMKVQRHRQNSVLLKKAHSDQATFSLTPRKLGGENNEKKIFKPANQVEKIGGSRGVVCQFEGAKSVKTAFLKSNNLPILTCSEHCFPTHKKAYCLPSTRGPKSSPVEATGLFKPNGNGETEKTDFENSEGEDNHSTPEFSQSNKNKSHYSFATNPRYHRSLNHLQRVEKHAEVLPFRSVKTPRRSTPTLAPFTTMLLGLGACFLLTNAPCGIYFILEDYYFRPMEDDAQVGPIMLVHAIVNLLNFANYSANFLLYCVTGSKFRMALKVKLKSLKRLFCTFKCCRRHNHRMEYA